MNKSRPKLKRSQRILFLESILRLSFQQETKLLKLSEIINTIRITFFGSHLKKYMGLTFQSIAQAKKLDMGAGQIS